MDRREIRGRMGSKGSFSECSSQKGNAGMTQIKLDSDLATRLHDMAKVVELCDPSGRVLGRFVPIVDLSEWEPISPEVSEDELDRRARSGGKRRSTTEVLAYLEQL
jgi:hypothetical protein